MTPCRWCALLTLLRHLLCTPAFVSAFSLALTQQSSVAADDAARNVREMEETCMMAVLHFDQAVKVDPVSTKQTQQICEHICRVYFSDSLSRLLL